MYKIIFHNLIIIIFLSFAALAQDKNPVAPIKWERYTFKHSNASIIFPKLPVVISSSVLCTEEDIEEYGVYADKTIYGLNIHYKSNDKYRDLPYCPNKKEFNRESFIDSIEKIKTKIKATEETKIERDGSEVIKIRNAYSTHWFIDDLKQESWYEIYVAGADESKAEVDNFVKSFDWQNKLAGIDVGEGSAQSLGDEQITDNSAAKNSSLLYIALRPRALYTDEARRKQVSGNVLLSVTFSANGSIENVSALKELPNGLTNQAIAAAKKIVFIPRIEDGVPQTVTKKVEYSFSVY